MSNTIWPPAYKTCPMLKGGNIFSSKEWGVYLVVDGPDGSIIHTSLNFNGTILSSSCKQVGDELHIKYGYVCKIDYLWNNIDDFARDYPDFLEYRRDLAKMIKERTCLS